MWEHLAMFETRYSLSTRDNSSVQETSSSAMKLGTIDRMDCHVAVPPLPDVGVMPWVQAAGAFCLMFASWGTVVSYGTFQEYYSGVGGVLEKQSPSSIAWIGSLQAFLLMFGAALTGTLYDAGYFRKMMYIGSFLMVFGLMMTSLASNYWQIILAQSVCTGCGMGLVALGALATPGTWFVRHRGLAVGLGSTGSSIGGLVFPVVLRRLIPQVGFGWAVRIMSFIVAAILVLPLAVSRQRLPAKKRNTLIDFKALVEIDFGLYCLGIVLAFLGFFIPYTFVESWAIATHLDTEGLPPYYLLAIMNGASTFGRLIPNYASDRLGPLNVQLPCSIIAGILVLTWIPADSLGSAVTIATLYGFFSGALVSILPTAIASMTTDLCELGGRIGMGYLSMAIASLIGSPVAGTIVQSYGYNAARIFAGALILAGSFAMALSRVKIAGLNLWVKA